MTPSIGIIGPNGFMGRSITSYFSSLDFELDLIDRIKFDRILAESRYDKIAKNSYLLWLATSVNPVTAQQNKELLDKDIEEFATFLAGVRDITRN